MTCSLWSPWCSVQQAKMRSLCSPLQSHPPTQHTQHYFLQVMAQGGRKSGSVASYMGLGGEDENRGKRIGLFDLLAASVLDAEWSRWAPITSPSSPLSPPAGHTHEYNRWQWIGRWLCFQGVIFEVNGSIHLCFPQSFSGRQQTPIKMFSFAQELWKIWPTTLLVYSIMHACVCVCLLLIFNFHFIF